MKKDDVTITELVHVGKERELSIPIGKITSVFEELATCVPVARMAWVDFDAYEIYFDSVFIVKQVPALIAGNIVPHMTSLSPELKEVFKGTEGLNYQNQIIMCRLDGYTNIWKITYYNLTGEDMFADDWYVVKNFDV
jgi:hypothetical protein